MPRQDLGPWGRWYATTADDTAHFTDRQFRAWANVFALAVKGRGELPKRRPLEAIIGTDEIAFLVSEGYLQVESDGPNAVMCITKWTTYQAPVDRTRNERQRRWYSRTKSGAADVDNALEPLHNGVSLTVAATSTSISKDVEPTEKKNGVSDGFDALDRYYELTMNRPWGRRAGEWLAELIETHGDVNVTAALEVEHKADSSMKTLLGRVTARLEKQADRVEKAAKQERRQHVDPVREAYKAAIEERYGTEDPELPTASVEEGRAAWAALKQQMNGSTPVVRSAAGGRGDSAPVDVGTSGSTKPTRDRRAGSPAGRTRGPSTVEQAARKS